MRWQRIIARGISEISGALPIQARPRLGYRVLMYHAIGTPVPNDRLGIYNICPQRFREHMILLKKRQDLVLVPLTATHNVDQLEVALTFDDGYKDNLIIAAPILQELQIPFTVFVTAQSVRECQPGFLTPSDLYQLSIMSGVTIGAHGNTHIPLVECSATQLKVELTDSKRYLEEITNLPVNCMSYPHGSVNHRVIDAVVNAGYDFAATSRFNINRNETNPFLLARTDIHANDNNRVFLQKIQGEWDWYSKRNLFSNSRDLN